MNAHQPAPGASRPAGQFNSSITRVWPVFEALLSRDPSGYTWLPNLLAMARYGFGDAATSSVGTLCEKVVQRARPLPSNMKLLLGNERADAVEPLRNCFEWPASPPAAFLRWMIENPGRLLWPAESGTRKRFGPETQRLREDWYGGDRVARDAALAALAAGGAERSARKWWAFEGSTSVDCYLETETLVLLIEGKRTEKISAATDWFPQRNQLARNVEVAAEIAMRSGKDFAVLLCAEQRMILAPEDFRASYPHLDAGEQDRLMRGYAGCVTWAEIACEIGPTFALPHRLDDAVELCRVLRGRGHS